MSLRANVLFLLSVVILIFGITGDEIPCNAEGLKAASALSGDLDNSCDVTYFEEECVVIDSATEDLMIKGEDYEKDWLPSTERIDFLYVENSRYQIDSIYSIVDFPLLEFKFLSSEEDVEYLAQKTNINVQEEQVDYPLVLPILGT